MSSKADRRPLIALFAAMMTSIAGSSVSLVAVPMYVLSQTGSALLTGVTMFMSIAPMIIASLLAGRYIDRIGYRRCAIVADLGAAASVMAIPIAHEWGAFNLGLVVALVFTRGCFDAVGENSRLAMLPDLIKLGGYDLDRATSWFEAVGRSARLIGTSIAGFIVFWVGPALALWADSATYVLSALVVMLFIASPAASRGQAPGGRAEQSGSPPERWSAGLQTVLADPALLWLSIMLLAANLFDVAMADVILPVFSSAGAASSITFGLLLAAMSGGAVIGAFAYGPLVKRVSRRNLVIALMLISSLRYFIIMLGLPPVATIAAMFVLSMAEGPLGPLAMVISFERIAPDRRGQVLGAATMIDALGIPIGLLGAGLAVDSVGLGATVAVMGAIYISFAFALLAVRGVRMFDAPAPYPLDAGPVGSVVRGVNVPRWHRFEDDHVASFRRSNNGSGWEPAVIPEGTLAWLWPAVGTSGWAWAWRPGEGWMAIAVEGDVQDAAVPDAAPALAAG